MGIRLNSLCITSITESPERGAGVVGIAGIVGSICTAGSTVAARGWADQRLEARSQKPEAPVA
eukprot:scaffold2771_cov252-Pinguiococcus_pyrenoidosus.AAC.4